MRYYSTYPEQTKSIAKQLAVTMTGGEIVLLHGELGAGKTTFVKGFAEGLGITEDITSPTFSLMNMYRASGRIANLIHIDTYRLENEQQLIDIGAEDYLGDEHTVAVIEWPEKLTALLKHKKTIDVFITHGAEDGEDGREIVIDE